MTDDIVTRLLALADSCPSPYCSGNCSCCGTFREAADGIKARDLHVLALEQEREDLKAELTETLKERNEFVGFLAAERALVADVQTERDSLKAKLAMGMQSIDSAWKVSYEKCQAKLAEAEADRDGEAGALYNTRALLEGVTRRAEKAEAEAAALREAGNALVPFLPNISYGIAAKHSSHQQAVMAFKAALSQPGPGAAYQEEMTRLKATCEWQAESEKIAGIENLALSERMRKLEALHAAVIEEEAALDAYDNHEPGSIPKHVRSHSALKACLAALEEKP